MTNFSTRPKDAFGNRALDLYASPLHLETTLAARGFRYISGIDEAGRAALAGPVVAAAVIVSPTAHTLVGQVKDSKQLSPKERETLFPVLMQHCVSVGVGIVESQEIDELNILQATFKAMTMAIEHLHPASDMCLVDGNCAIPNIRSQQAIVKGDQWVFSISAASIVAKVTRDRIMIERSMKYPMYGFAVHKGYGTLRHRQAIASFGPCEEHRRSFRWPTQNEIVQS